MRMSSGLLSVPINVRLQASDEFGNFTKRLYGGDKIQFHGQLINTKVLFNEKQENYILGTSKPAVKLVSMKCMHCQDKDNDKVELKKAKTDSEARLQDMYRGIKYLLNVLLSPLITFK